MNAFLEKDLLRTKSGDAEGVTEKALLAMRSLVSAVGYKVPVPKEGYMEILQPLAGKVQ